MSATRSVRFTQAPDAVFENGIRNIRDELDLPNAFPAEVEAAAEIAARNPRLPDEDRTDIPFITIDPPSSMDLDQALHVERRGSGYRVYYAIADVAAFVTAGDGVDREANRRGETLYGADQKIPLHPKPLSEAAASLLPDQDHPALLWTIDVNDSGEGTEVDVHRALVRSRAKLNYAGVQAEIDAGKADPMWAVLKDLGELRMARERRRGAISIALPEQEIHVEDGRWQLAFRPRRAVEDWNEQISLLTGMAGAHLMVEAGVGLLRTLPEPPHWAIERLRRTAEARDIKWSDDLDYPSFISSLDPQNPTHIAMMIACTTVLRGASYAAFEGGKLPEHPQHSALASTYSHVTAPLRRLVDRYTGETCVAICAGKPVPEWVLEALPGLPDTMRESSRLASRYEHAVLDLAEAVALAPRIGETFDGMIVEIDREQPERGVVVIRDPAIEAQVSADAALPLGTSVKVRLVEADPVKRSTSFALAGS